MSEITICPRCGIALPAGTGPAQCPRCLLRLGFDTDFVVTGGPPRPKAPPPSVEELAADFPQLEILELLGRGGMGAVFKARQTSLERLVALKILSVDLEDDPSFAERFAREARALAALDHPSIVRVYDSGRAGGRWYFVMEFVDGTDLRRMLRAGRVAPREALAIVGQVCDALQYAHDQGVVHRDIKPENILVDRKGRVKIADFGLAKLVGRAGDAFALTGTHQAMGTPHYMAPEQIERPQEVDHRADIYSLGVVLYELLTGELPLGRFVPPSSKVQVDLRLDEVVLKALEKEPPRRYQHASEVKSSLDELERPGPRVAEKQPESAADEQSAKLRRLTAILAIGLFLVGALLGAFQVRALVAGGTTLESASLVVLPWLLLAAAALILVARSRRRRREEPRQVWPWLAGCLGLLLLVPVGIVLVFLTYPLASTSAAREGELAARARAEGLQAESPRAAAWVDSERARHGALCVEIDAAREITARRPRLVELTALARRPGLGPHEQAHLAEALLEGGFSDEIADGLVALIEHQELEHALLLTIRKEVGAAPPSVHKTRVLEALARELLPRR